MQRVDRSLARLKSEGEGFVFLLACAREQVFEPLIQFDVIEIDARLTFLFLSHWSCLNGQGDGDDASCVSFEASWPETDSHTGMGLRPPEQIGAESEQC